MEKVLRQFDSQTEADRAEFLDDNRLTCEDRFRAFMQLMSPYYDASVRFQRVYRTDAFKPRTVRDDWGLCLQPVSKSTSDR